MERDIKPKEKEEEEEEEEEEKEESVVDLPTLPRIMPRMRYHRNKKKVLRYDEDKDKEPFRLHRLYGNKHRIAKK